MDRSVRSRFPGSMFTIFAVAFAALAGLLIFAVLQSDRSEPELIETRTVVVAAVEIPPRTVITSPMLRLQEMPLELAIERGYSDARLLVGLIARFPIAVNEQISEQKVGATAPGELATRDGLSFVVPRGMRAVGISISESSAVGGLILAGDRVDVIALWDEDLAGEEKAVTLLQDVEVLSVAQIAQEPVPPPAAGQTPSEDEADDEDEDASSERLGLRPIDAAPQPKARTVTLAVSPEDAQILALIEQHTSLWLTLRAFEDSDLVSLDETTLVQLGALPPALRP